jgi:hypothetical protein
MQLAAGALKSDETTTVVLTLMKSLRVAPFTELMTRREGPPDHLPPSISSGGAS